MLSSRAKELKSKFQNIFFELNYHKFLDAIRCRDFKKIKKYLAKGADINFKVENSCTPLQQAIQSNCEPIIGLLLQAKDDDHDKNNALLYAVKCGSPASIIKFLVNSGADINAKDAEGRTALSFAVGTCDLPRVKMLMQLGAKDYDSNSSYRSLIKKLRKLNEADQKSTLQDNKKQNEYIGGRTNSATEYHYPIIDARRSPLSPRTRYSYSRLTGQTIYPIRSYSPKPMTAAFYAECLIAADKHEKIYPRWRK